MNLAITIFRCLLPCALSALVACAPLATQQAEYPVGRVRLALPAGSWEDLGMSSQAVPLLPEPGERIALQTRTVALRDAQQQVVALLRVRANRSNFLQGPMYWPGNCPAQRGMVVEDATQGSPVRVDCLRLKRWVDGLQWLEQNQPDFARVLAGHKLRPGLPYSYLSHHYATESGATVTVDVLVDQRLLSARTRNNDEFLVAGRPALQWGHALAQAVRVSTGMMDGFLAIPPFPFTPTPL